MLDIRGAVHVRSSHTPDVTTTPQAIATAAAAAGLDFVVLTDRNTLGARVAGDEGQYGPVTLIAGYEVSPAANHCLILGYDELLPETALAEEYLPRIHAQGGLGFIAHPHERGPAGRPEMARPWQNWRANFGGIEIWNLHQDLTDDADDEMLTAKCAAPGQALRGPDAATLAVWDNLTTRRRIIGIAGSDTDAGLLPQDQVFGLLTNHLLVPEGWRDANLATRRELLLRALAAGHVYIAAEHERPARVEYTCQATRPLGIGDEGALTTDSELFASVPGADRVRIIRAGEVVAVAAGDQVGYRPRHRGAYRLEAHYASEQGLHPWVLTNPIYLR